jgi:putative cell wall-binding protein
MAGGRWGKRGYVVAVLALLATTMASPARAADDDARPRVLLVGDSLLEQSAAEMRAAFGAKGYAPSIRAVSGTGLVSEREFWMDEMRDLVEDLDPDVVVVEFTGNHGEEPWPVDAAGHAIEPGTPAFAEAWCDAANEAMSILTAGDAEVWWVLNPPIRDPNPAARAAIADFVTMGLPLGWPELRFIDWDAALASSDGTFTSEIDGAVIRAEDGVHLEGDGPRRVAAVTAAAVSAPLRRVAGTTPDDTAILLARERFTASRSAVLVSRGSPSDAVVAAPLAARLQAPLLYVDATGNNDRVREELLRIGVDEVTVVGGELALSSGVIDSLLDGVAVSSISRLAGHDRFETAAVVSRAIQPSRLYVTRGSPGERTSWIDAATAAATAARTGGAILLTDGVTLTESVLEAARGVGVATVVGGTEVVATAVDQRLAGAGVVVDRVGGIDRYDTAERLNGEATSSSTRTALVVGGHSWPDAALAASLGAREAVVLVHPATVRLSSSVGDWLPTVADSALIVGDIRAVSTRTETELAFALAG